MLSVNKLNLNFNLSDVKDKFEKIDSNKDGKLSTKVFIILKDSKKSFFGNKHNSIHFLGVYRILFVATTRKRK
jgi:hypothetical protein